MKTSHAKICPPKTSYLKSSGSPRSRVVPSLLAVALLVVTLVAAPALAQAGPGSLRFERNNTQVREGDGLALATVVRRGGSDGVVTVDFETQDGSAVVDEDYTAVAGTLTWEDGQQGARVIEIPILDDEDSEGLETFRVVLSNPTGDAEIARGTLEVRILPSDRGQGGPPADGAGVFKFDQGNFKVVESAGMGVITVERFRGSEGEVSVTVETADRKATAGEDYEETTEVLEWGDGEGGRKTVEIPLLDDGDHEPSENVLLTLSEPTGGAVLDNGRARALMTIKDDDDPGDGDDGEDGPGEIAFAEDGFQVIEDGDSASIAVVRRNGSTGAVSVEFGTADGSAVDGEDYTGVGGMLSWEDGEDGAKSFEVEILDDDVTEGNETVELSLSNPTGGAVLEGGEDDLEADADEGLEGAETATAQLTILDNDGEIGLCDADDTTLCLSDERFRVSVVWRTPAGDTGVGQAVTFTEDTGFFWFFDDANLEVMVKVLDACELPAFESFWVFFAATTNVDFTVTVVDTVSGVIKEYTNAAGEAAEPVQDTVTFETCP